jgi:hypothetical protein
VDSSFIDAVAFYDYSNTLEVRLNSGQTYTFLGIPKGIYDAFMAHPSKGKFFNQVLKPFYAERNRE